MLISEKIYKYMEQKGMTQKEFSQCTGISQSTISDWRRKKTNPSADKILNHTSCFQRAGLKVIKIVRKVWTTQLY